MLKSSRNDMIVGIGFVLTLFLLAVTARAETAKEEELMQRLEERDKVILELLKRVEALEKRVGVSYPRPSNEKDMDASTQTTGYADKDKTDNESGRGPGISVDLESAERALERSLTREGVLLLPKGFLEIEPGLTYSREENSTPLLFTSDNRVRAGEAESQVDSITTDLSLRLGLPWDAQVELGIPYRWRQNETLNNIGFETIDTESRSGSAFGDIRVGLAKTILREGVWWPDLVGRFTWDTNSGKQFDDGVALGGGYHELRGSLTAIKRQDPIVFAGGLSYEYSFEEDNIHPGSTILASFGSFIALSPETSMRFLLSGGYQDEIELSGVDVIGSDRTLVTFEIGGTTLLAPGSLLNVSVGFGLSEDADDFSLSLSLPFRFSDSLF